MFLALVPLVLIAAGLAQLALWILGVRKRT